MVWISGFSQEELRKKKHQSGLAGPSLSWNHYPIAMYQILDDDQVPTGCFCGCPLFKNFLMVTTPLSDVSSKFLLVNASFALLEQLPVA